MWAYDLDGPRSLARAAVARPEVGTTPQDDSVVLRVITGGICGSDIPFFRGRLSPLLQMTGPDGRPGFPLHEVVGEVVEAGAAARLEVGARVVGWAAAADGLAEYVQTSAAGLYPVPPTVRPLEAVAVQPLACVLHTLGRLPEVTGARVAVIGLGPIGLMFAHAAKSAGAAHVTGVDPVDRSSVAARFGVDELVRQTSDRWADRLTADERPAVVIEAVGHQVGTLVDAVTAVADEGTIFYFGVPDDLVYPVPLYTLFRKSATLISGPVTDRLSALRAAVAYAERHPGLLRDVVTHVFPAHQAADAFACADVAAPGRLKVVIDYREETPG